MTEAVPAARKVETEVEEVRELQPRLQVLPAEDLFRDKFFDLGMPSARSNRTPSVGEKVSTKPIPRPQYASLTDDSEPESDRRIKSQPLQFSAVSAGMRQKIEASGLDGVACFIIKDGTEAGQAEIRLRDKDA